jgi:hypothetical protein
MSNGKIFIMMIVWSVSTFIITMITRHYFKKDHTLGALVGFGAFSLASVAAFFYVQMQLASVVGNIVAKVQLDAFLTFTTLSRASFEEFVCENL